MHASSKSISGKSGRLKTRSYAMGQWGMRNRKWWVVFRTEWDKEIISWTNFRHQACPPGDMVPRPAVRSYPTAGKMKPWSQEVPGFKEVSYHLNLENGWVFFRYLFSSHSSFTALFRGVALTRTALPLPSDQGLSERTPLQPTSILRGSRGFPRAIYPIWFHGLKHTHTHLGTPRLTPQTSSQSSLRARTPEILGNKKVSPSLPTPKHSFSKDIQVGRENHLLGSQRLDFGDEVLNCCPLLMLNAQQSALRCDITTIDKNSPFVSRAWRAFEI